MTTLPNKRSIVY